MAHCSSLALPWRPVRGENGLVRVSSARRYPALRPGRRLRVACRAPDGGAGSATAFRPASPTSDQTVLADQPIVSSARVLANDVAASIRAGNAHSPVHVMRPVPEKTHETIDFWSYWWPVVPVEQVDLTRPLAVDLLGMQLVVWQDSKGGWHAFKDLCPHRLAPLSEGVVVQDQLMCSYHGWQFSGAGRCTKVPQIEDPKAHATTCASPRNCVQVFPIKVVHGLLWIYPKPGKVGEREAAEKPVPSTAIPALLEAEAAPDTSNYYQSTAWFFRDMPIRFDTLVENTLDPSHVYFAHHGAPGVSRDKLVNPEMAVAPGGAITARGGFMVERGAVAGSPASTYGLVPPHLLHYVYASHQSVFYCVPTKPGWSRVTTCMIGYKDAEIPKPLQAMAKLMARFPVVEHVLLRHEILDGDLYMLHAGERKLLEAGNKLSAYYMPANADLSIILWRQWLARHAGEVPTCTPADAARMPPLMSKEQVLDRYEQHTSKCKTCQGALRSLERAMAVASSVGAVTLVSSLAALVKGDALLAPLGGLALAAACGAVCLALINIRKKFFFVEYVHAHK